jgi:phage pi2 protein 07
MVQQLSVNLTIPIPQDSVLIGKVELEELRKLELSGVYWNTKEFEHRTGKKHEWLKENILFRQQFRKELDSENGGFVFYPKGKGQTWSFQASKMAVFLDKNFHRVFK